MSARLDRPRRSLAEARAHYAEMRLRFLFVRADAEAIGQSGLADYCERELDAIERRLEMLDAAEAKS